MLSQLSSDFFARSPLLAWPVLALGIFMCVFVIVSVRALLTRREEMQRMAELPFRESEGRDHG